MMPLIKSCMPDLKINTNNTRTSTCYDRLLHKSDKFYNLSFPIIWSFGRPLIKVLKKQNYLSLFKDNLKLHRHYEYGNKRGNRFLAHFQVGRSFLNSHRFVTVPSETDKYKKCNKNEVEIISHYTFLCPALSFAILTIYFFLNSSLVPNFPQVSQKDEISLLINGINHYGGISDCQNVPIMFAMQNFILSTKRFQKQS